MTKPIISTLGTDAFNRRQPMTTRPATPWVYIMSEPGLLTVGFYDPDGKWHADSDHDSREEAAKRVHYLNGGSSE